MCNTIICNQFWRLFFLLIPAGTFLAACSGPAGDDATASREDLPNIVLIVSDDHGTGDLGAYGNSAIHTPNLDYLAPRGSGSTRPTAPRPPAVPVAR